jgi:Hypothetical protein FLILHELTA
MKFPLSQKSSNLKITAVAPLIGLTYLFHKAQWTPSVLPEEWLVQGAEKGEKLIRHYGLEVKGDQFVRLAFEFAAAYATVKVYYILGLTRVNGVVGSVTVENCGQCLADALVR